MISNFIFLKKLGEGSFSQVYLVKRISDGELYALKKVKMNSLSEKEKQNALNEVRLLASVHHPFIIGYKEAFIDEGTSTLCLVVEYADNGDFLSKIQDHSRKGTLFKESDIWVYFLSMVIGLKALHDKKICHRDIKCANIFLNSKQEVKLGDFNVSKVAKKGMLHTQTGTPYYASPEVWLDRPYDSKSDIWSLGCVLYEIITLKPPFQAADMKGLYKKVVAVDYQPLSNKYSSELQNVIKLMLQGNPNLRPSCDQLLQMPGIIKNIKESSSNIKVLDQIKQLIEFQNKENQNPYFDQTGVIGNQKDGGALLGTIKLPRILKHLQDKLPKANYKRQHSQPGRIQSSNSVVNNSMNNEYSNPVTPKNNKRILKDMNNIQIQQRPISSGKTREELYKYPSLNPKYIEQNNKPSLIVPSPHNCYEDQYFENINNNKENQQVIAMHYLRYKKGANAIRKSADPHQGALIRVNRANNISNIVEGVEKRINDVLQNNKRASPSPQYQYIQQKFEVNYPYEGIGGIPNLAKDYQEREKIQASRNGGGNIKSHNIYEHLR